MGGGKKEEEEEEEKNNNPETIHRSDNDGQNSSIKTMKHIYIRRRIEKVQVQFCIGAIKKLPIGETIERAAHQLRAAIAVKDGRGRRTLSTTFL